MKFEAVCNTWFPEKHYGFLIEVRNGKLIRYFFHSTGIISGAPKVGVKAKFDLHQNERGLQATNVEFENPQETGNGGAA